MAEFLACEPNVFVIGNDYQIVLNLAEPGPCFVRVGDRNFYEDGSGIFYNDRCVHKISVPQSVLDEAESYTVMYRRMIERRSYCSRTGDMQSESFAFRPIKKTSGINCVYVADMHGDYEETENVASYFGDDLDLFIVNGDFGESDTLDDLVKLNDFIGKVTHGAIPTIVGRGNHDTRGMCAELLPRHIATNGERTYFTFSVGPISGVVLDCGEDKYDDHPEYGGVNWFEPYREQELEALRGFELEDKPYKIAVCHVPFMSAGEMSGQFDIMPELYRAWNTEVERMAPEFMICGHVHWYEFYPAGDENAKFAHNYPVIVASSRRDGMGATAVIFGDGETEFRHIAKDGKVTETFTLPRK